MCLRMKFNPHFTPYTESPHHELKINVRPKTIKSIRKSKMKNVYNIGLGKEFLDMTPKAYTNGSKNR